MKYTTFYMFVREAAFHAVDFLDLEYESLNPDWPAFDATWRTIQRTITDKDFDAAEKMMLSMFKWIRIPGVVTYLPHHADVRQAYGNAGE